MSSQKVTPDVSPEMSSEKSDGPPISTKFWLLDWTKDDVLTKDDLVTSLMHIAYFPRREEVNDFVERLKGGTMADFEKVADHPLLKRRKGLWNHLTIMRDSQVGALLESKAKNTSFLSNVFWMSMAFFGSR